MQTPDVSKKLLSLFFATIILAGSCLYTRASEETGKYTDDLPAPPEGKVFQLVWHDEFDGTEIDDTKWMMPDGVRRDGFWTPRAAKLNGRGYLLIAALEDDGDYLSAALRSSGRFEHSFGYYVARIRLQQQPGHWSAFWLNGPGTGSIEGGGRDGTEIDIYEKFDQTMMVFHNLHWDGYGEHHKHAGSVAYVPGIMKGFHTFGLWWKPDEYVFYIDGKETWSTDAGGVCQVPNHVILSNEIGKQAGDITKAELPDYFVVDYVRVYDLADEPD